MASLLRRIQRMPKRKSVGAQKRMFRYHIGDRLGVKNNNLRIRKAKSKG